ncbi:MAG TPA: FAD:protein FMN transferase, partial [Nitrospirales bacterium]|nr:FAD:protein FMN transferase [Nitrospirales bacterium]
MSVRFTPLLAFLLISVLSGCATQPHVIKRGQMLMGTLVQVTASADDDATAERAAAAGLAEIRRLEERLSTWIATSDLSRVNAAAGAGPVAVGPEAYELVARSLEIARLTDGGFSVVIGPAVDAWSVIDHPRIPEET